MSLGQNIFSSSDNIYKFLVSIGIVIIVASFYYPLDRYEKYINLSHEYEDKSKQFDNELVATKSLVVNLGAYYQGGFKKKLQSARLISDRKIRLQKEAQLELERFQILEKLDVWQKSIDNLTVELQSLSAKKEEAQCFRNVYLVSGMVLVIVGIYLVIFGFTKWFSQEKGKENPPKTKEDAIA